MKSTQQPKIARRRQQTFWESCQMSMHAQRSVVGAPTVSFKAILLYMPKKNIQKRSLLYIRIFL